MNEQRGNVIENKGSAFRSPRRSGNVIENKGGYALKAGILLKTKDVGCMSQVVGEEAPPHIPPTTYHIRVERVPGARSGFRIEDQ